MARLKIYVVTMKDGEILYVKAYTHSHAMERAEICAIKDKRTGKGRQAAKAEPVKILTY